MPEIRNETGPDRENSLGLAPATGMQAMQAVDADVAELLQGKDLLEYLATIESTHETYVAELRPIWERNLQAARNEHSEQSKYKSTHWKARSKLFRPKTASSIRKNLATAAAALFSTNDVVQVSAEYEDDPEALAGASVNNHVLNYRLDRTSTRAGIPWFQIAMGANKDAQIMGLCCSKQVWEFEKVTLPGMAESRRPMLDQMGQPIVDPMTGQPAIETVQEPRTYVAKDRPMIYLVPFENVIFDIAAPWYDIVQGGGYFCVRHPMSIEDWRSMTRQNSGKNQVQFLDLSDDVLRSAAEDYDAKGVRFARDGRQDAKAPNVQGGAGASKKLNTIWPQENFVRVNGVDLHFWSIGSRAFASTVKPTIDVYPHMFGQRPYVVGVATIDPHTPIPQSPVGTWQPIQTEINDLVNLRLDAAKQAVEPIAKVKQGSIFDVGALRNRGAPGATITVRSMDDLEFDRWPDAGIGAYQEMNFLNADFDDLSGTFSGSSVQTNRSLNETVGGLRLLSGSANALTEYDLRVWVETWVEPALRQVLLCLQAFESDAVVLQVAGSRAQLQRFGVSQITDDLLAYECNLRVNVGIGSADPMQRIGKLGMAMQMLGQVAAFADKPAKIKTEEFIKEVMGAAGYKDGMRFFDIQDEPPEPQPTPEEIRAQTTLEKTKQDNESRQAIAHENNQTKLQIAGLQARMDTLQQLLQGYMSERGAAAAQQHQARLEGGRMRQQEAARLSQERRDKRRDLIGVAKTAADQSDRNQERGFRERQAAADRQMRQQQVQTGVPRPTRG